MPTPHDKKTTTSTRTTGNDPVAGADPGGTRSTKPGQRDKSAPRHADPAVEQAVTTGADDLETRRRGPEGTS
ncbi:MAG: hypothetical protein AB7Q01_02430 [Gammaproteobacteria bacterium]